MTNNQNSKKKSKWLLWILIALGILMVISLPKYQEYKEKARLKESKNPQTNISNNQSDVPQSKKTDNKKINNGWAISQSCQPLKDLPIENQYQKQEHPRSGKPEYSCSSPSLDLGNPLAASIIYTAYGTKDAVSELDLSVEYWDVNSKQAGVATAIYMATANELAKRATGKQLPEGIPQNMLMFKPIRVKQGKFTHELTTKENHIGIEMHYLITRN